MPHQPPADRSVLDSALDPPLAMDDETIRALETDVRLATHLRADPDALQRPVAAAATMAP